MGYRACQATARRFSWQPAMERRRARRSLPTCKAAASSAPVVASPPSQAPGDRRGVGGKAIAALGVAAFLFLARLMLARSLGYISPEECHTGGIAREILQHGFQFPLVAYTPE